MNGISGISTNRYTALEQAIDLDPRNVVMLQQIAMSYDDLRRYADEKAMLDRALTIESNDVGTKTRARGCGI